jgi:hypothetical protein
VSPLQERLELAAEFARAGDPQTAATRARQTMLDAVTEDDRTEARIALDHYEQEAEIWRAAALAREHAVEVRELADSSGHVVGRVTAGRSALPRRPW